MLDRQLLGRLWRARNQFLRQAQGVGIRRRVRHQKRNTGAWRLRLIHVPYTPSAAEVTLSNETMDYWARFAATGDPNGGGAVQWLPYDAAENILRLDDTIANLPGGYRNPECDYLSTVPLQ